MITGLWGKKIGMTQLFQKDKVVPVTVINTADWFVTQIKSVENDGYDAVQVACLRPKFVGKKFDLNWTKKLSTYFCHVKEIKLSKAVEDLAIGQPADFFKLLAEGNLVDIFGKTIGRGFQGTVKRHNFKGGAASHGDATGRRPGALSFMRGEGRVVKGKKMPGHMGTNTVAVKNLEIIKIDSDANIIAVKGSIPGKAGSLIYISKHG